ncbi:Protein MAK16 [Galdieria sulphuraria]|uniref:Protein MAK16 homolog n=1 Tax=Galdieria sulphuraria TaxID=130081 RepID=M2Y5L4_GALSU|nr:RNA binding protein [Galdieria sulphuraria]EME31253.1 RNA binding protein [Galdieria sulphuraria]GJD07675.1 Protein MAK16 [Galdieria sulphuraria]|eukprot:XP_005707773.1 RNA binding protein [Galdieria sulphuraria]
MQSDDVIWSIVGKTFCSFRVKITTGNFCKNPYNLTGICARRYCPLANSRYATIIETEGDCFLYLKTIERAHLPNAQWEKVKLSNNYKKALEQIDEKLHFWPHYLKHKAKQRLTKIKQYLIRKKRLQLKLRSKVVPVNNKLERRERKKEKKALSMSKLDKRIEEELLSRLRSGKYKDIYNFPLAQYETVLEQDKVPEVETMEFEEDYESDDESEEQWEEEVYEASEGEILDEQQTSLKDIEDLHSSTYNAVFDEDDSIQEEVNVGKDPTDVLKKRWSRKVSKHGGSSRATSRKRSGRREFEYEFEDERLLQTTD